MKLSELPGEWKFASNLVQTSCILFPTDIIYTVKNLVRIDSKLELWI